MTTPAQIRCSSCLHANPSDRKFCGQCGVKLWEPCIQCEAVNAVDARFCGNCGVDLEKALADRVAALRGELDFASRLENEGRYFEAASALRSVSAKGDSRLKALELQAADLLRLLNERREVRNAEAEITYREARDLFVKHQFGLASQRLLEIPVGLRSEPMTKLLKKTNSLHSELADLTTRIRQALKSRQFDGLLPKVQRLCHLQPDNKEAKQLAERLSKLRLASNTRQAEKLEQAGRRQISEFKYEEAVSTLEQVDPEVRRGKLEELYREAKELAWCAAQLRHGPIADPALLQISRRLCQMRTDDIRSLQLSNELAKRSQAKPKDPRFPHAPWASAPEQTTLGHPVKWWSGFSKPLIAGAEVQGQLSKAPGRFVVAYGLALQGLGQSVLQHNLNPENKSWSSRLLNRRARATSAWGVDLGPSALKAVQLVQEKPEDRVAVQKCVLIPHSKPLMESSEEHDEIARETVRRFVETLNSKRPRVVLGFPATHCLGRFVSVPALTEKKIGKAIQYEARHQIPLPVDETVFDYHLWEAGNSDQFLEMRPVTLVAARRSDLQDHVQRFVDSSCEIAAVQCDSFAVYNALHQEFLGPRKAQTNGKGAESPVLAVLDIGMKAANLVIGSRDSVWYRTFGHGAEKWNVLLTRRFSLTRGQAEKVRRDMAAAKWLHQIDEALSPAFAELADEIHRTIRVCQREQDREVQLLLGTGGGFGQFGLLRFLTRGR